MIQMLYRIELLQCFTLASVFAFSSARIEWKKNEEDWAEEKPLQIVISWYLKHAHSVNVQVIHRTDSDFMYRHSAKLIQVVHEKSGSAVTVRHHFVEAKDPQRSFDRREVSSTTRSSHKALRTLSRAGGSQLHSDSSDWTLDVLRETVSILLVPDEAALQEFLESVDAWRRRQLKSSLIVVTPSKSDALCQRGRVPGTGGWRKFVKRMLKKIWTEDKVLNRFVSFPTLPCVKEYLFAWNPFIKGKHGVPGILKRLKVTASDPSVEEALSEFVITVKNMHGYPFRAVVFERTPTLLKSEGEQLLNIDEITGLDGLVLKTMTSWMNCTVELYPPSNGMLYGYRFENGTFVGMIGDLVYRRVDFAANGVFLKDYQTETATEFTTTISSECICIVVPRAGVIPQWLQIFQCFSPLVKYMLFICVVSLALLRYIMGGLVPQRRPRPNLLITVIEMTLIFTSSPQVMPRVNSERILVGFYLMFGVIIIGTFQGTLYENFTNPMHFRDLSSLVDLDESGLRIGTTSPNLQNVFGEDEDSSTLRNLHKKVVILHTAVGVGAIDRTAWVRDIASIERKNDLLVTMKTDFLDEHGEQVLHVVDECPRTYQLTYMVPSGAFFLNRVNLLLRRMVESGLIGYWYHSTVELLIMKNCLSRAKSIEVSDKATPFSLEDIQTSFIILAGGLLLSIIAFIGENIKFRHKVRRASSS